MAMVVNKRILWGGTKIVLTLLSQRLDGSRVIRQSRIPFHCNFFRVPLESFLDR